ncbi:MAG TPA: AgmX/PglI C-terminal domain-containing protein [Polyangiaceae bacterium]
MRKALWSSLFVPFVALPLAGFACGGGQTGPGVQAPVGSGGDGNAAGAGTPAPTDSGPTTTTTVTLADGGDLQGAKLQQSSTVASTTGSSAPQPSGPHSHDPGRGPADIRAIVVAHRDAARACYDAALPSHPGIEGDLVMQWTIDPKGNVSHVSEDTARSQITEPGVVACIAKIIQSIQFASSPGGFETKAFYPFNFHPRHGQGADAGS